MTWDQDVTCVQAYLHAIQAGNQQPATGYAPRLLVQALHRDVMFTGRIDQAEHMKQVYYNEGWSGPNKYTFEVYQLENGSYRALARKWNGKINKVQQETQYLSDTREGLKHQDYPRTRQVKIFLNSDFWENGND